MVEKDGEEASEAEKRVSVIPDSPKAPHVRAILTQVLEQRVAPPVRFSISEQGASSTDNKKPRLLDQEDDGLNRFGNHRLAIKLCCECVCLYVHIRD